MSTLMLWVPMLALLAIAGLAWLSLRSRERRVPVVLVQDRYGRTHEIPADDPRITGR